MNKKKKYLALLIVFTILTVGSLFMSFNSYGSYKDNLANMEYNLSEMENAIIVGDTETAQMQSDWAFEAAAIVDQRKMEMIIFLVLGLVFAGGAVWSGLRSKK